MEKIAALGQGPGSVMYDIYLGTYRTYLRT